MSIKGFRDCNIYLPNKGIIRTSLQINKGKIVNIDKNIKENELLSLPEQLIVVPGFIDKHIHGANASDFMNPTFKDIRNILTAIAREGTTSCLATTMTQRVEILCKSLKNISDYMALKEKGVEILGIHLEGPFISPKYAGAQPLAFIKKCNVSLFDKLNEAGNNQIKQVTLACEENGIELIKHLREKGIVVSLGHTDSSYDIAENAVKVGISSISHTFNAMRGFHHRDIGVTGLSLLNDNVNCELICDLIHVSSPAIQLLYRNKPKDKICLITDSMEAKYMPDGIYQLGGQKVVVCNSEARLENGNLAGSTLKLNEAIYNFMKITGIPLTEAIDFATINPARCIGVDNRKGSIEIGKDADFVVIDSKLNVYMTICLGEVIYSKL